MKKRILIFILSVFSFANIFGQNSSSLSSAVDSLRQIIKKANHDTIIVKTYIEIGDLFELSMPDSAIYFYQKAADVAQQNYSTYTSEENNYLKYKYLSQFATAVRYIGVVQTTHGDYEKAIENYLTVLKFSEILIKESKNQKLIYESKKGMSMCFTNIGVIQKEQRNYDKTIEYYLKALSIKEELNDKRGEANCIVNLASIYGLLGNYDKSIEYFSKALSLSAEIGNKLIESECYYGIGNINLEQAKNYKDLNECKKSYETALFYYFKALKIKEEINDKSGLVLVLGNISNLNLCIADSTLNSAKLSKAERLKYFNESIKYGLKSFSIAEELNSTPLKNKIASYLFNSYKEVGNISKSLEFALIYIRTKDKLFNEEKTKALTEMSTKYESEKKQLEIDKMQKQKELDNKTIEAQQSENRKQQVIIISSIGGFVIILIFSLIIFRMFRHKRKANILLEKQNAEISQQKEEIEAQRDEIETQRDLVTSQKEHIEEIHKNVTDSINYAERIQRSFLATKELLDENLKDYFVLFRPKDVVSGDFYWAGKLNNGNFAVVTADSTGHGVPGAIMSILNISSIEKAIEQGENDPSEILNKTRKTIIERLKKDGSSDGGKDGMDASLICFNFNNQLLTYASANSHIWVIRENNLIVLESDKMPIGKHEKDKISFNKHEFQLMSGDIIFTLTDGFQDQFGGANGKKFLSKNLKQLIVANCQLPMEQQKQVLENTLIDWIGDGEQIDDITILGIKI